MAAVLLIRIVEKRRNESVETEAMFRSGNIIEVSFFTGLVTCVGPGNCGRKHHDEHGESLLHFLVYRSSSAFLFVFIHYGSS